MAIIKEKGYWRCHDTAGKKSWVAEISDIERTEEQRCPVCSHPVVFGPYKGQMSPTRDGEGDITHWTGICCCGTELTIFND